jgi:hypothetical protein
MTMPSVSLASSALELEEFAEYFGRNVVTIRKWFANEKDVICIPRGGQRPTMLIPVSTAERVLKKMGFPDEMVKDFVEKHRNRVEVRVAQLVPAPSPPIPEPKSDKPTLSEKVKKPIKSAKFSKNTKLPRTRKPPERRRA